MDFQDLHNFTPYQNCLLLRCKRNMETIMGVTPVTPRPTCAYKHQDKEYLALFAQLYASTPTAGQHLAWRRQLQAFTISSELQALARGNWSDRQQRFRVDTSHLYHVMRDVRHQATLQAAAAAAASAAPLPATATPANPQDMAWIRDTILREERLSGGGRHVEARRQFNTMLSSRLSSGGGGAGRARGSI